MGGRWSKIPANQCSSMTGATGAVHIIALDDLSRNRAVQPTPRETDAFGEFLKRGARVGPFTILIDAYHQPPAGDRERCGRIKVGVDLEPEPGIALDLNRSVDNGRVFYAACNLVGIEVLTDVQIVGQVFVFIVLSWWVERPRSERKTAATIAADNFRRLMVVVDEVELGDFAFGCVD